MEMLDNLLSAIKTGGGYTDAEQAKINAGTNPSMVEKGSILGMTPSTFASVAGQMGSAITPKDSWQSKLGGIAAQMGSQKLGQLMQAEKEKRATDLYKQMLKVMSNKQIASGMGNPSVGGVSTGIPKPMTDLERMQGGGA